MPRASGRVRVARRPVLCPGRDRRVAVAECEGRCVDGDGSPGMREDRLASAGAGAEVGGCIGVRVDGYGHGRAARAAAGTWGWKDPEGRIRPPCCSTVERHHLEGRTRRGVDTPTPAGDRKSVE